jgi:multiple sugar transport system permease protein
MTAGVRPSGTGRPRARFDWTPRTKRNLLTGLLFISPWMVGFVCFYLYPALASLYYSFTDFKILEAPRWIGLGNYQRMIGDPLFWKALSNTLYLALIGLPLSLLAALGIALILNIRNIVGMSVFRTVFYLPVVIPTVAGAVLWIWMLNPQYGLVNQALAVFGIKGPAWFFDPVWTKPGIILMMIWGVGDVVIIYLGALQGVPRDLYESADVDGAGRWTKVRHITIPMVSPAILFNLITGAIAIFQYFTQAYVISEGTTSKGSGPIGGIANSLLFYGLNLYNNAFRYFRLGYASALAWVLLVIILGFTVAMLWASRRRVYYESER